MRLKKILIRFLKIMGILFILLNAIVAMHAYKFTHFYNHGEKHIKTDREKTKWDVTKDILFGIDAEKQLNTAPDTACETVNLTTKDGIKIEGWYTSVTAAKGTVCMFHGHGGKKSGNNAEAAGFRKLGYNTFQIDFRAHGSSGGNSCAIGYEEAEEVKMAYDFIKTKGETNIVLWGISMGAAAITSGFEKYDSLQPQKVILEMPFGKLSDAVAGRIKMMELPAQPIGTLLTFWGGVEHGFWAFNYKPQEFAKKIKCPTLLQWGIEDPRVSRKEEETLFANLPNSNKKFVVYNSCKHESLCTKENAKWITEVSAFLQ